MPKYEILKTFSNDGEMVYTKRGVKVFTEMKADEAKPFIEIGALKAVEKKKKESK